MASPYPNLGFDPCPGDLRGYQALADYAGRSATTLVTAVQTLASANSQDWRGQAADAFRTHVHQEVMPLARKASGSVGVAATALRAWAVTLAGLQDEARALDRQAAPYRDDLDVALRSAGLPAGSTPPYPATVKPAQQARLDQANSAHVGDPRQGRRPPHPVPGRSPAGPRASSTTPGTWHPTRRACSPACGTTPKLSTTPPSMGSVRLSTIRRCWSSSPA